MEVLELARVKHRAASNAWYYRNKPKVRLYLDSNREMVAKRRKKYREMNKEKIQSVVRAWHEENKDHVKQQRRVFYYANRERLILRRRSAYLNNREVVNSNRRAVYKANPEKYRKCASTVLRESLGSICKEDIEWLYGDNLVRFGVYTCELCGKAIGNCRVNIDHKTPITRKGTHDRSNLHLSHWFCNKEKKRMTMEEWVRYKHFQKRNNDS